MKISEFLFVLNEEELIKRIIFLDRSLKFLHQNNYYVISDFRELEIVIDGGNFHIKPDSIKVSIFNEEKDVNSQKYDILELTALEICAFNRFVDEMDQLKLITESGFINSLFMEDNLNVFLRNVPKKIRNYYRKIYINGNIKEYLCDYLVSHNELVINKKEEKEFSPLYRVEPKNAFANYVVLVALILSIVMLMGVIIVFVIKP